MVNQLVKCFGLIGLFVFVLGSCATQRINPSLQSHVDKFYRVAAEMGYPVKERPELVVKFYDFGENGPAGQCVSYRGREPVVRVNKIMQPMAQSYEVEYIVFHELAHCVLGLAHDNTIVLGQPFSMMHPTMMHISQYVKYREAYWQELFSRPRGDLWD